MSGADYEFRVSGQLSEQARHAIAEFGDVRVVDSPAETLLLCADADESRAHGVLALLDYLGLRVVSMAKAPPRGPAK